jgi:hypothetical protein
MVSLSYPFIFICIIFVLKTNLQGFHAHINVTSIFVACMLLYVAD